jgi:hypothetical protein
MATSNPTRTGSPSPTSAATQPTTTNPSGQMGSTIEAFFNGRLTSQVPNMSTAMAMAEASMTDMFMGRR